MNSAFESEPALADPQRMREAQPGLLSLALMDARNRSLRLLSLFEDVKLNLGASPQWLAGHAGWFQELWIGRNTQRARGPRCPSRPTRLASIEPQADAWFAPGRRAAVQPSTEETRDYLAATLDGTLDLLDKAANDDQGLYFFRLALLHEDRLTEALQVLASSIELPAQRRADAPVRPVARARRDALWFPAQTVAMGLGPGGLAPDCDRGGHDESLPEFEIDAQPVCWSQFAEFAADGGYDEPAWWHADGWSWLQHSGRRAPRGVEQWASGVLALRQGRLQRLAGAQAAAPLSWYEADAWCRWAGRRLPSEPEWESAARQGAGRGWVMGDAFEWVASSARAYPAHQDGPARLDRVPDPGSQRVLRGGSLATARRRIYPEARRFAAPRSDEGLFGFRSCAS